MSEQSVPPGGLAPPRLPDSPHLSHPAAATRPPGRSPWLVVPLQVVLILVLFAGVGLLCALLWEWVWTAPRGVVQLGPDRKPMWFPLDEKALRGDFSGTGWFLTISLAGGVLVGAVSAWLLARAELVTVAAVSLGALLASYLMMRLGVHLGPADEQTRARAVAVGTRLPEHLAISGGLAPYLVFPLGALGVTGLVLFLPRRGHQG